MNAQPSPAEVRVAIDALRSEADAWEQQSHDLEALSAKVNDLALGRIEAGVFVVVAGPYNEVVRQVAGRTREGTVSMRDISTTLRQVASTYEAEDAAGQHSFDRLH